MQPVICRKNLRSVYVTCRSELARAAGAAVYRSVPGNAIAGKPDSHRGIGAIPETEDRFDYQGFWQLRSVLAPKRSKKTELR